MERLFENLGSVKQHCPWTPQGALQRTIWTPTARSQHADARQVMAYGHNTQSFMKNGVQQKCLDKALYSIVYLNIFIHLQKTKSCIWTIF